MHKGNGINLADLKRELEDLTTEYKKKYGIKQTQPIEECNANSEYKDKTTPVATVLAWGFKNKKTGRLNPMAYPTRDSARDAKEFHETVIRVQITEA